MKCPYCDHDNPNGLWICEDCGANFQKSAKSSRSRSSSDLFSNLSSCFTSCISYFLVALLIALTIGAVAVFSCTFDVPEAPEQGYPVQILDLWEKIDNLQKEKCVDVGFAGEIEEKGIEEIHDSDIVGENGKETETCGFPSIRFEPVGGTIGTQFDIFLEGFSANDEIEACWYYPSGELINCAELDANENGFRKTSFWSEENDPPGEYRMEAKGECSEADAVWLIEAPGNEP